MGQTHEQTHEEMKLKSLCSFECGMPKACLLSLSQGHILYALAQSYSLIMAFTFQTTHSFTHWQRQSNCLLGPLNLTRSWRCSDNVLRKNITHVNWMWSSSPAREGESDVTDGVPDRLEHILGVLQSNGECSFFLVGPPSLFHHSRSRVAWFG